MMREREIPVTCQPGDRTVYVLKGTRVLEAAAEANLVLDVPCGGEGRCGKCRVQVTAGAPEPGEPEQRFFSPAELQAGWRLACQCAVKEPATVVVPQTSLVGACHQIVVHSAVTVAADGDPVVTKHYVELNVPARGDDHPDAIRLEQAIGPFAADLELIRQLPGRLRETNYRGTAVLADGRLLDFEPGNTEATGYGVAVDVGTTTLAASLLDLATGREAAVASRLNPQTRFGDDVLSRILFARDGQDGLGQLQETIVAAIDEMVGDVCRQAGIDRRQVYVLSASGNTTMQQLLARIDPRWLGEVPFVPALGRGLAVAAGQLGLSIHPRGQVYVLPVIGGFVGGDTVAGILATALAESQAPTLLVDVGTNGEIVLAAGGRLLAASTAAGPAFEGARISQGMRASTGAIEKVMVDDCLRIQVIGDAAPVGLCGSALIDAAAELLRYGILSPTGRLLSADALPARVPPDLERRICERDGQAAFMLADAAEAADGRPVVLTQRDLRELQLAAGAIRAGIGILLRRSGLKPADLDRVLIAGGFGNYIRRENAQRIGLLPVEIPAARIRYQGNTSLAGARLTVLSRQARQQADDLAAQTEHVDLSFDPGFREAFAEAMLFPEEGLKIAI